MRRDHRTQSVFLNFRSVFIVRNLYQNCKNSFFMELKWIPVCWCVDSCDFQLQLNTKAQERQVRLFVWLCAGIFTESDSNSTQKVTVDCETDIQWWHKHQWKHHTEEVHPFKKMCLHSQELARIQTQAWCQMDHLHHFADRGKIWIVLMGHHQIWVSHCFLSKKDCSGQYFQLSTERGAIWTSWRATGETLQSPFSVGSIHVLAVGRR